MQNDVRLLDSVSLENGLTVFFHDLSKSIVGGRCQVQLLITIPLEIREDQFQECDNPKEAFETFRNAKADGLCFRQEKFRNFIKLDNADDLLRTLREEFLKTNRIYLSKPDFEKKFVLKKYAEWKENEKLRRTREEALQDRG